MEYDEAKNPVMIDHYFRIRIGVIYLEFEKDKPNLKKIENGRQKLISQLENLYDDKSPHSKLTIEILNHFNLPFKNIKDVETLDKKFEILREQYLN